MAMSPRLLRPRASGFDPRSIATLSFWLDASDANTVTTVSGAVSSWASKVGSVTATQDAAANRPAYTTAGRNGRNVVTFDGGNDWLTTGTLSLLQPYTVFWAGNNVASAFSTNAYLIDGTTAPTRVIVAWNIGSAIGRIGILAGELLNAGSGTQAYDRWSVVTAKFDSTSSSIRADGVDVVSGNAGSGAITALRLGERFIPLGNSAFNGPWGELLIYTGSLSVASVQRVEKYLANKWSVTL